MSFQIAYCLLLCCCIFKAACRPDGSCCNNTSTSSINCCACTRSSSLELYVDCSHKAFDEVPSFPPETVVLNLDFNRISVLNRNDFDQGYNLKNLSINNNSVSTIANGVFTSLKRLKYLDLSYNNLKLSSEIYKPGLFKPLENLEYLFLHHNYLDKGDYNFTYPDKTFADLIALKNLTMDGLRYKMFGYGFSQMTELEVLTLSGTRSFCMIKTLTNNTFKNLKRLKHLDISMCYIKHVEADSFTCLSRLEYLDISYNVDLGFRSLENISYGLQLSNIRILKVNKLHETFGLGTELRINDVRYLQNTTLSELHLDSNRFEVAQFGAISHFPRSLYLLSIKDNKITFGWYLFELSALSNITIVLADYQNGAHSTPVSSVALETTLSMLRNTDYHMGTCEGSKETPTDQLLSQNSQYEAANASGIGTRENLLAILENVKRQIHDSNTLLVTLPKTLKKFSFRRSSIRYGVTDSLAFSENNLQTLDISGNNLYKMIGPFKSFGNLKYWDLSDNYCSEIGPNLFTYAPKVEVLNLQNNLIGFNISYNGSEGIFAHQSKIQHLNLSSNRIEKLPKKIFSELYSLTSLDLSSNFLSEFAIEFDALRNLTKLDLSNNKLPYLPADFRQALSALSSPARKISVNLYGNALQCGCEQKEFLKWMQSPHIIFPKLENYTCRFANGTVIQMRDVNDVYLNLSQYCASYLGLILGCTIAGVLFISLAIGGLVYRYRWKLRYVFYMTLSRRRGHTPLDGDEAVQYKYDAFISYSDEQYQFIRYAMMPKLEEECGLKLCIHQRDFLPGNAIEANITDAVRNSRKTVVVLSKEYLRSHWCQFELQMAKMEGIYSRNGESVLFVILKEQIPMDNLSPEIWALLTQHSYIAYPTNTESVDLFWNQVHDGIKA